MKTIEIQVDNRKVPTLFIDDFFFILTRKELFALMTELLNALEKIFE